MPMYDNWFFKSSAAGVVGLFSLAVTVEALEGHEPIPHIEPGFTIVMPGGTGTSSSGSSGTMIG